MKKTKNQVLSNAKGITLVALIITIIVMIILAGVAVYFGTGNSSVMDQAEKSSYKTEKALVQETINTSYIYDEQTGKINWGETVPEITKNIENLDFTSTIDSSNESKPVKVTVVGVEGTHKFKIDRNSGKITSIEDDDISEITGYDVGIGYSSTSQGEDYTRYNTIGSVRLYPLGGNYSTSYDYMVAKGNSKELILEQVNYLFEAEARARKAIDNIIENYDLQQYLDNTELLAQKLEAKKPTGEGDNSDKYEFDSQSALMGALLIKEVYQYKNNASKTAVANGEQESEITEIFFDESGNPRQFTTLEEAVEYLKKADRVETFLRHDFVLGIMTMEGGLEDLNVDVMSSMIDSGSDFDFKGLFAELDKMEGNTFRDIYNVMLTMMGQEDDGSMEGKDLHAIVATSMVKEFVPEIRKMELFNYFNEDNDYIKDKLQGRTISEYLKDVLELVNEEVTNHTQLQNDINGIYEMLNGTNENSGWKNSKGFTVADQIEGAVFGDYENLKIEIFDEAGNKLGNEYYNDFSQSYYDSLGDANDYLSVYAGINLTKVNGDTTVDYYDTTDKLTVKVYNGEELVSTVTKTAEEFGNTY